MIIRLATEVDCDQALHLLNQLGEIVNELVSFDPDNVRAHEKGRINYLEAMKRKDRKVFVVEENNTLIGVATFFILHDFITGKPFAHLDDFVVDKSQRGKGVGTRLLEYIKTYAKDHGIHTIELTSSLPLTRAHKFYENRGGTYARKVIKFLV